MSFGFSEAMQSVLKEILTGIRLSFSLCIAGKQCQMPFLPSDLLPRCDKIRSHKKNKGKKSDVRFNHSSSSPQQKPRGLERA